MNNTQALAQTNMFGILDESINRVFGSKEHKDKAGTPNGVSITLKPRKEIALALGLKPKDDKEKLDEAILKSSDDAFRKVKAEIAGLNGEWTLHKVSTRNLANGQRQITVVTREVSRKTTVSDEKVAKAWFPDDQFPGMSLDEKVARVALMREQQQAELAKQSKETIEG